MKRTRERLVVGCVWGGTCKYFSFEHVTFKDNIKRLRGSIEQPVEYKNLEISGKAMAGDLCLEIFGP